MVEYDMSGAERHDFSFLLEVQTLSVEACTFAAAPLSEGFLSETEAMSTTTSHSSKHDHAVLSPGTYCSHVVPVLVVVLLNLATEYGQTFAPQGSVTKCIHYSIFGKSYGDALTATLQQSGVRIVS